jgi:hypothetical protein
VTATTLPAQRSAEVLERTLGNAKASGWTGQPLTIADAATKSGLALRDAERGLHFLSAEYRGQLRVTDKGELLFVFPTRFEKPWVTRDWLSRVAGKVGRFFAGLMRFIVRAWLTIVLLAYVAVFLAIVIGLVFARASNNSSNDRDNGQGGRIVVSILRVVADALFWTFHPFSPFSYGYGYGYGGAYGDAWVGSGGARGRAPQRKRSQEQEIPFYERVNRFFFGPPPPKVEEGETERRILAEIRRQRGRIGLADVMRVTGLPRAEADPLMARLMVDYDGDVGVSEDGGITYKFEALRATAEERASAPPPEPAWSRLPTLPPLTGNGQGTNFLIVMLNSFNIIMSLVAIDSRLTLSNLGLLFSGVPSNKLPLDGVPVVLGLVPLVFSLVLFLLPLVRAALRPGKARKVADERGRLAVLREVLTKIERKEPVTEPALASAYERAAGTKVESKDLTRTLVRLGGDVDVNEKTGQVRYRFVDLETEAAALEAEREAASEEERKPGKVVFSSDE